MPLGSRQVGLLGTFLSSARVAEVWYGMHCSCSSAQIIEVSICYAWTPVRLCSRATHNNNKIYWSDMTARDRRGWGHQQPAAREATSRRRVACGGRRETARLERRSAKGGGRVLAGGRGSWRHASRAGLRRRARGRNATRVLGVRRKQSPAACAAFATASTFAEALKNWDSSQWHCVFSYIVGYNPWPSARVGPKRSLAAPTLSNMDTCKCF